MTDAELEQLCRRENIDVEDGRGVRKLFKDLCAPQPGGIDLPHDRVGFLVETSASLANALFDDLSIGAPFYACAKQIAKLMRQFAT